MTDRGREAERARAKARQPAGLEAPGRDETLVHPPEVHPSGMRADSRGTVPGTEIPNEEDPNGPGRPRSGRPD